MTQLHQKNVFVNVDSTALKLRLYTSLFCIAFNFIVFVALRHASLDPLPCHKMPRPSFDPQERDILYGQSRYLQLLWLVHIGSTMAELPGKQPNMCGV